jgi:hypothetical protein
VRPGQGGTADNVVDRAGRDHQAVYRAVRVVGVVQVQRPRDLTALGRGDRLQPDPPARRVCEACPATAGEQREHPQHLPGVLPAGEVDLARLGRHVRVPAGLGCLLLDHRDARRPAGRLASGRDHTHGHRPPGQQGGEQGEMDPAQRSRKAPAAPAGPRGRGQAPAAPAGCPPPARGGPAAMPHQHLGAGVSRGRRARVLAAVAVARLSPPAPAPRPRLSGPAAGPGPRLSGPAEVPRPRVLGSPVLIPWLAGSQALSLHLLTPYLRAWTAGASRKTMSWPGCRHPGVR